MLPRFLHQTLLAAVGVALASSLAACGGDSGGDAPSSNGASNDTSGTSGTSNGTSSTSNGTATSSGTTPEACEAGGSFCEVGECVEGACVTCARGSEGCACMNNGGCDAGLRCEEEVCAACPVGEEGCPCDEGDACGEGLTCMGGVCAPEVCEPGEEGCPCGEGDVCDEGLTCGDDSVCRPCSHDVEGCPCDVEGACEGEELTCDEEGVCVACTSDVEGCPCDEGDRCAGGLVCDVVRSACRVAVTCSDAPCVANQLCEDDAAGDARCLEACMPGWVYNGETGECDEEEAAANCDEGAEGSILAECQRLSRVCVSGEEATCGECLAGFVDEDGALTTCRPVVTCAALDCAAQSRVCEDATDRADARCGDCAAGFAEVEGACLTEGSCEPGAEGSILATCEGLGRACVVTGPRTAECGACEMGSVPEDPEDMTSACRAPLTCAEVAPTCEGGQRCFEAPGRDAFCAESLCEGENQAFRRDTGACVDCGTLSASCGVNGETGELWLYTREGSDTCLCETQEGYYADISGTAVARPCDRDGDGWVRLGAKGSITSSDPTIRDNARCALRTIDRFVLQNEYNQRLTLHSCADGASQAPCPEGEAAPIPLYESDRNDDQVRLDNPNNANLVSSYDDGAVGRPLTASEINPLTRACVTTLTDYNDNDISDFAEHHRAAIPANVPGELIPFVPFSYFVELHRSWYEPPVEDEPWGAYVIAERSRCEPGFPLTYDATAGPYWRSCARNRDAAWHIDPNEREPVGFDFAQWSCDAATGSCPLPPPPVAPMSSDTVIPHGLCEIDLSQVPEEPWRGMSHHSQFKCALVDPTQTPQEAGRHLKQRFLHPSELYDGAAGGFVFNRCHVACPVGDLDCADDCDPSTGQCSASSDPPGGLLNNRAPRLTCEPILQDGSLQGGEVGFVAVRYVDLEREDAPTDTYLRGCLDEWRPGRDRAEDATWRALCPGHQENPNGTIGQGNPNNFGALLCGCGEHYGGAGCAQGCPTPLRGGPAENDFDTCFDGYCPVVPEGEGGGRRGVWVCGGFSVTGAVDAATTGPDLTGEGGLRVRGGITLDPVGRAPMCADEDCASGPSIR